MTSQSIAGLIYASAHVYATITVIEKLISKVIALKQFLLVGYGHPFAQQIIILFALTHARTHIRPIHGHIFAVFSTYIH